MQGGSSCARPTILPQLIGAQRRKGSKGRKEEKTKLCCLMSGGANDEFLVSLGDLCRFASLRATMLAVWPARRR